MQSDRTVSANGHPVSPSNGSGRAELAALRDRRRSPAGAAGRLTDGELVEVAVAFDARAPGAARRFVAQCLERRVVASALDSALLVVSELVTNSLQHGDGLTDEVVVSVELMPEWFRVSVQDSGSDAVIAAHPPDLEAGGGFGLNLVQMLSERWGVERLATGGTQVWAQLRRAHGAAAHDPGAGGLGRLAIRTA